MKTRKRLFNRHPAGPPTQPQAFTGRGCIPDLLSEHAACSFPAANKTTLENGFVPGALGMMPVAGNMGKAQKGQATDTGAGGAGSFATRPAFGARG